MLATTIRQAREDQNMTITEAASRVGVSHGTWRGWENAEFEPKAANYAAVIKTLGFRPDGTGLAEALTAKQEEMGVSLTALAAMANIPRGTMYNVVNDRQRASSGLLASIVVAFGFQASDIA